MKKIDVFTLCAIIGGLLLGATSFIIDIINNEDNMFNIVLIKLSIGIIFVIFGLIAIGIVPFSKYKKMF